MDEDQNKCVDEHKGGDEDEDNRQRAGTINYDDNSMSSQSFFEQYQRFFIEQQPNNISTSIDIEDITLQLIFHMQSQQDSFYEYQICEAFHPISFLLFIT